MNFKDNKEAIMSIFLFPITIYLVIIAITIGWIGGDTTKETLYKIINE